METGLSHRPGLHCVRTSSSAAPIMVPTAAASRAFAMDMRQRIVNGEIVGAGEPDHQQRRREW